MCLRSAVRHYRHHFPEHISQYINRVDSHIHKRSAACLCRVLPPYALNFRIPAGKLSPPHHRPAKSTLVYHFFGFYMIAMISHHKADLQGNPFFLTIFNCLVSVPDGKAQRFFTEHMFSRIRGPHYLLQMSDYRSPYVHGLYFVITKKFVFITERFFNPVFPGDFRSKPFIDIFNRQNFYPVGLDHPRYRSSISYTAASYDPEIHFSHLRYLSLLCNRSPYCTLLIGRNKTCFFTDTAARTVAKEHASK